MLQTAFGHRVKFSSDDADEAPNVVMNKRVRQDWLINLDANCNNVAFLSVLVYEIGTVSLFQSGTGFLIGEKREQCTCDCWWNIV